MNATQGRAVRRRLGIGLVVGITAAAAALSAEARVTRIVISTTQSPTYNGASFGSVGPYERLIGTAYGELDPADRRNAIIQDIALAPRNAAGKVEYAATFTLVKPVDMSKSNGILFYNVNNRGNRNFPFNLGGDPGDGFLQSKGYVLLWSGWQGDLTPAANNANETIQVPVAKNPDGSSITGPMIFRFSNVATGTNTISLAQVQPGNFTGIVYQSATLDTTQATLETHAAESQTAVTGAVTKIASTDWAWADCRTTAFPGTPDPTRICLKNGADPALLYQLVFTARDPLVLGIGLAATRDVMSFFHNETADSAGTANPIAGTIQHVLAQGTSQSGNLVKTFLHLGFNEDEKGRIVAEGVAPHIAARQTPLNFRFALPGGAATLYEPGSDPVLWWEDWDDTARGRAKAGILDRCRATNTCPKIIETFGSTEFWDLRHSPGLASTSGNVDIPLPDNVRRYYMPGTSHGGGSGAFSLSTGTAFGAGGTCMFMNNPNPEVDTYRALFIALKNWVVSGKEPPPSQYPKVADGTLVEATRAATGFPMVPSIPFTDHFENTMLSYDFGSGFVANDMSGVISKEPPGIRSTIPTLVPAVDSDGNEIVGVESAMHQAPLGTYLGWNITTTGFNKGRICAFTGGFVPFAKTRADRAANGDPRPSLEERYGNFSTYYFLMLSIVGHEVAKGYLLPEDASRVFQSAIQGVWNNGLLPKRLADDDNDGNDGDQGNPMPGPQ